jgi:hypothetical protein
MPTPRKYPHTAARQAAYRIRCREQAQVAGRQRPLPTQPGRRRWEALCGQARDLLEQVSEELEAYAEARTEAWQESARGEVLADAREAVAQVVEALAEVSFC